MSGRGRDFVARAAPQAAAAPPRAEAASAVAD
jgi:hypothetical protein